MRRISLVAALTFAAALSGACRAQDVTANLNELIKVANDPNSPEQEKAIKKLGNVTNEIRAVTFVLRHQLGSGDAKIRRAAAETLDDLGPAAESAEYELISASRDPNVHVRLAAVDALGHIGPLAKGRAVPALIERLSKDKDVNVRRTAAGALAATGPYAKDAVPALMAALKDPDEPVMVNDFGTVQNNAIYALGEIGPGAAEAAPTLAAIAKDKKDLRRLGAITALGGIGTAHKDVLPALLDCMQQGKNDIRTRTGAAAALGKLGPGEAARQAVPALIDLLKEEEEAPAELIQTPGLIAQARCCAAQALGQLGPDAKSAVKILMDVMVDVKASACVNQAALKALGAIGPDAKDAIPVLMDLHNTPIGEKRFRTYMDRDSALVGIGKGAVPALLEKLQSSEPREVDWAMRVLARIGRDADAAAATLNDLAKNGPPSVRGQAAETLKAVLGDQ
jgi:HEAT repeat protein